MTFTRILPIASVFAAGALAFTLRTATATPTHTTISLDDPTIVAIFDEANTADIETGELAAKMGSTKTICDFGAMLARDHQNVRQQGRDEEAERAQGRRIRQGLLATRSRLPWGPG